MKIIIRTMRGTFAWYGDRQRPLAAHDGARLARTSTTNKPRLKGGRIRGACNLTPLTGNRRSHFRDHERANSKEWRAVHQGARVTPRNFPSRPSPGCPRWRMRLLQATANAGRITERVIEPRCLPRLDASNAWPPRRPAAKFQRRNFRTVAIQRARKRSPRARWSPIQFAGSRSSSRDMKRGA